MNLHRLVRDNQHQKINLFTAEEIRDYCKQLSPGELVELINLLGDFGYTLDTVSGDWRCE